VPLSARPPVKQLSWPERFAVTVVPQSAQPKTYTVTTWLHELKAVALAVGRHQARQGEADAHRLYDVHVEALGPASAGADGVASANREDLIDRTEW
jgi:predicted metal-dependent HD superfamily phosphohydrolase